MDYVPLFVFVTLLLGISVSADFDGPQPRARRQLNLGNLLRPSGNKVLACETPLRQTGRCVPMEQCVLKELDEDYVKNKGYLCALGQNGPVGVCCSNTIRSPVVYRDGMFGNKNIASGKLSIDDENNLSATTPENEKLVED